MNRAEWEEEWRSLSERGRKCARPPRIISVSINNPISETEWGVKRPVWWARVGAGGAFRFLDIPPIAGFRPFVAEINLDDEAIEEDDWIYFGIDGFGERGRVLTPERKDHKSKLPRLAVCHLLRLISRLTGVGPEDLQSRCAYRTADCRFLMRQAGLSLADVSKANCITTQILMEAEDKKRQEILRTLGDRTAPDPIMEDDGSISFNAREDSAMATKTETVVLVSREDAVTLLTSLKYGGAAKWPTAKLSEKINQWGKHKEHPFPVTKDLQRADDKKTALLLNRVVKNLKEGATIEVGDATPSEAEKKEEKAAPKKTSASKNGTPAASNGKASKNGEHKAEKKDAPKKKEKGEGLVYASRSSGVLSTIASLLKKATKQSPISKEDLLKKLSKEYPERSPEKMLTTLGTQLHRLTTKTYTNISVHKEGKGLYWAE